MFVDSVDSIPPPDSRLEATANNNGSFFADA